MRLPLFRISRTFPAIFILATSTLVFALLPARADDVRSRLVSASSLRRTATVDVVEKNQGAVVNIFSERTVSVENREKHIEQTQMQQRVNGMGTGVVIDPRGYIITNHHVVDDVQVMRVRLHDGSSLTARILVREPAEDLAIIKIDPPQLLATPMFGTATDLSLGETVIAIGNAFGYEHTVTMGVVSALKRDVVLNREVSYKSLIQTDASINPGNSGGPLFNINGELIGINVAIRAGAQGIGFTIPVDTAMRVAADMMSVKRRTGTSHGMIVHDNLDASGSKLRRWATVDRVEPNSPADKAGLHPGDVIERAGDIKVVCALDVERSFIDYSMGDKLKIVVRRGVNRHGEGGDEVRADLVLKSPDRSAANLPAELIWKRLGLKVTAAPLDQVTLANPQLHGGLLITDINGGTPAAKAGFQRGDILIGLHQWETVNIDNIAYVLNHPDLATFAPIRFYRIRGGQLERGWLPNLE